MTSGSSSSPATVTSHPSIAAAIHPRHCGVGNPGGERTPRSHVDAT
jgi:hypothetical protein